MADQTTGPAAVVTNAQAGAAEFAGSNSRSFNYYKPKGRRATLYEDVTVDVQPDPKRYLLQGWLYAFADGTPTYSLKWTRLQSSDWHVYRDPSEEWERTIYIREANTVRQIQRTMEIARLENVYARWDKSWVNVLQTHVSASMHPEYGLGMYVFLQANRDAMTNMINNAIAVWSADKLRYAQDLALYNLELSEQISEFDGSAHKQLWLNDPAWQGVRENVELLAASTDWAEQIFATNVIYELLCGKLFRSQFVLPFAGPHGDYITPSLVGQAEYDYERNLASSMELFRLLADDPMYGAENRRVMQEWLVKWTPLTVSAARLLEPIWMQPTQKVLRFEDAFNQAKRRFESILSVLHLQLLKEVVP